MKIIIDTNIWISYFIGKNFDDLKNILLDDSFEIVFSNELLEEIKTVINRPKFGKIINSEKLEEMINLIIFRSQFYKPFKNVEFCRDRNDDFLLSLSEVSGADFLVTGDFDLLDLKQYKKTEIVKWHFFISSVLKKTL